MDGTLHHIELYVSNLEASQTFWGWFLGELGYQPYQDWPQGFSYRLESTYLVFVATEKPHQSPPYHRKRTGLNHIAFRIDPASLEGWRMRLKERGIPLLYPDQELPDALFFEDPDRIKVELAAYD